MLKRLDLFRPSKEEMLKEISQSGLSISIENGNVDYLTTHKDELISTMWKVVKISKYVDPQDLSQFMDDMLPEKSSRVN